ncbi:MAG: Nramp family divalent metal transporter [Planctomycetes bacterium]|nr:Nramp family divalent metal transporter [Planctomycetota bacterium]
MPACPTYSAIATLLMPERPVPAAADETGTLAAPTTPWGILQRLGPGLIIAASIVGSGELILTTKTGAEAGYSLLWLILIGCVVKVFVQVEIGRFTIVEGRSTMEAMNMVQPKLGVSWMVWFWLAMFLTSLAQLGGICGGVGQSLAMTFPLRGDFIDHLQTGAAMPVINGFSDISIAKLQQVLTCDDVVWSIIVAVATSVMLVLGRYNLIQTVSTILVAGFTLVTMFDVAALPFFSDIELSWADIRHGLSFHLPEKVGKDDPLVTALATFGIIGVGANELIAYPYWCLEKGYASFVGVRNAGADWAERARGWLRVMRWDSWCSMVIYTFATIAFYMLGAAVLNKRGLDMTGFKLVYNLAAMYTDVFGRAGQYVFLIGAFAVLYSTFFVALAGHSRVVADALRAFHLGARTEADRQWWVKLLSGAFPIICLLCYIFWRDPGRLVAWSGFMQTLMLPMLGGMAIWNRYKHCDPRVAPGRLWDVMLWISMGAMVVVGVWAVYANLLAPHAQLLAD